MGVNFIKHPILTLVSYQACYLNPHYQSYCPQHPQYNLVLILVFSSFSRSGSWERLGVGTVECSLEPRPQNNPEIDARWSTSVRLWVDDVDSALVERCQALVDDNSLNFVLNNISMFQRAAYCATCAGVGILALHFKNFEIMLIW